MKARADVLQLAWDLGVIVYSANLDRHIRGVLHRTEDCTTELNLNRGDPVDQQRATAAYALSFFWRNCHRPTFGFVFNDNALRGEDQESRRAVRFATALLGEWPRPPEAAT